MTDYEFKIKTPLGTFLESMLKTDMPEGSYGYLYRYYIMNIKQYDNVKGNDC